MIDIIRAENVEKVFGERENQIKVLKDINFSIGQGEFVSIMGPSGCGKSTLLYLLGGLDTPTSGNIYIDEININHMKDTPKTKLRRENIGFVFQFYNLVQNLSVEENIMLPVVMSGKKASRYQRELSEVLQIIGLEDKRNCIPSKLSGGQQQRVSIARAVIISPKIILADEPIGNLDSKSGKEIMELFSKINKEKRITILQVTHSKESALYGNRMIHISDGKIVKDKKLVVD
ncbi:MAG: ABC transporter ATP-binding protein [Epulopiscium sp.]|nr:ABC transporter ATP-binding protein [Candidatus Epulonipiscium sp.]